MHDSLWSFGTRRLFEAALLYLSCACLLFLSGLVFHGDRQKDFGSFLAKEFKNLMLPYYGTGILSILIYEIFGKRASSKLGVPVREGGFLRQIGGMVYGSCKTGYMKWNLPLWFLPCLFVVFLMAWVILRRFQKIVIKRNLIDIRLQVMWLTGIICLVVFFGIYLTDIGKIAMLPFGLETGVRMLPFFLAGTGTGWILKDKGRKNQTKEDCLDTSLEKSETAGGMPQQAVFIGIFIVCLGICAFSAANNTLVLYHRDEYGKEILFYIGAVSGICLVITVGIFFKDANGFVISDDIL